MDLLSVLLDQMNIYLGYYQLAQLMVECHLFYLHNGKLNIFHFYIGVYLWKKTIDGKLINKHLQQNWKYGNNKFFFSTINAMNHDIDCSASNGICFLADTLLQEMLTYCNLGLHTSNYKIKVTYLCGWIKLFSDIEHLNVMEKIYLDISKLLISRYFFILIPQLF